jgi:ABC-type glycerol-3-phosphate transport system permease component
VRAKDADRDPVDRNLLWHLVIIQDRSLQVPAVGLTDFAQSYSRTPQWAAAMAASTVATLPIAVLFVFFQEHFIKDLTAAAVRG